MAKNKTNPTTASVQDYIASRANEQQAQDCSVLTKLMQKITKQPPTMWGPSIVGFGTYHYTYASGRSGDAPLAGYAIRGREIVVYLFTESDEQQALLAKLGPHKVSKACLYFKKLDDLDRTVLEKLIRNSIAEVQRLLF